MRQTSALRKSLIYWAFIICTLLIAVEAVARVDDINETENQIEYQYRYAVDESESKGPVMDRWEQRIGEYVKGAYSVLEPDGRVRIVDYEVDGNKGYHAVIRMNDPIFDLLSYQQVSKSFEVYPESPLPSQTEPPARNLSPPDPSTGKAWNYHSEATSTDLKHDFRVPKSQLLAKNPRQPRIFENLPLSPANFNVPQTTNVIYYEIPSATIFQQKFEPLKLENNFSKTAKRETLLSRSESFSRPRNSKLVRRYNSFVDFIVS